MRLFRKKYDQCTDEELVQYASKGEERAFELLYDRYSHPVHCYFIRMLWKDEQKAADFTQDLFVKVAKNLSKLDTGRSFKTWLFSVANNMCKNAYRHAEVVSKANDELQHSGERNEHQRTGKELDHQTFRHQLEQVLGELDEEKRSTFHMRYDDELSIKEISEIMECSEGTVKSRLFYTLKHLSKELSDYEHLIRSV